EFLMVDSPVETVQKSSLYDVNREPPDQIGRCLAIGSRTSVFARRRLTRVDDVQPNEARHEDSKVNLTSNCLQRSEGAGGGRMRDNVTVAHRGQSHKTEVTHFHIASCV